MCDTGPTGRGTVVLAHTATIIQNIAWQPPQTLYDVIWRTVDWVPCTLEVECRGVEVEYRNRVQG